MADVMNVLTFVIGLMLVVIIGVLGAVILWKVLRGQIKLDGLLAEPGDPEGKASLSRFQFLLFTFVIALSLILVILGTGTGSPAFPPDIPGEIFVLLGVSGGSFLVSKEIQSGRDAKLQGINASKEINLKAKDLAMAQEGTKLAQIGLQREHEQAALAAKKLAVVQEARRLAEIESQKQHAQIELARIESQKQQAIAQQMAAQARMANPSAPPSKK